MQTDMDAVTYVVGNKVDRGRVVSQQEGEQMSKRVGAAGYSEVSAKDGTGVQQLFHSLTEAVIAKQSTLRRAEETEGVQISATTVETSGCAC